MLLSVPKSSFHSCMLVYLEVGLHQAEQVSLILLPLPSVCRPHLFPANSTSLFPNTKKTQNIRHLGSTFSMYLMGDRRESNSENAKIRIKIQPNQILNATRFEQVTVWNSRIHWMKTLESEMLPLHQASL